MDFRYNPWSFQQDDVAATGTVPQPAAAVREDPRPAARGCHVPGAVPWTSPDHTARPCGGPRTPALCTPDQHGRRISRSHVRPWAKDEGAPVCSEAFLTASGDTIRERGDECG
ncbi:hypothetical protein GCM10010275_36840 [Streptomyces litmocidini]|nr:hypothetical protein GCM10010275_36840 [Streptomyces litmocidini]